MWLPYYYYYYYFILLFHSIASRFFSTVIDSLADKDLKILMMKMMKRMMIQMIPMEHTMKVLALFWDPVLILL